MRPFHWTKKTNAIFVPEIDDEHQVIYRTADELEQALDRGAPLFQVHETLHRLISIVEDHFSHEESMMRSSHYESFPWHKQQHDTVRERMKDLAPLVESGDAAAAQEMIAFLSKWLHDHTALTDRMMGAFLRNHQRAQLS